MKAKAMKSRLLENYREIPLPKWADAILYFGETVSNEHGYIWRGHAQENWNLVPSLYRCRAISQSLRGISEGKVESWDVHSHCSMPKQALQSAFQLRADSREVRYDCEQLWALSQHHGGRTPLLDWTRAPLVAVFFAYAALIESLDPKRAGSNDEMTSQLSGNVAIWGLFETAFSDIAAKHNVSGKNCEYSLIEPLFPGNRRSIAQQGVFTYIDVDDPLESIAKAAEQGPSVLASVAKESAVLVKALLPKALAVTALTALNRMGINYRTLFPDIEGVARHATLDALLPNYHGMIPNRLEKTIENLGASKEKFNY